MDSERRHDLEENSLNRAFQKAPEFFRQYGSYLLLGLAALFLAIWIYRMRAQTALMERQASAQGLYNLVEAVGQAQQLGQVSMMLTPEQLQEQRQALITEFETFAPIATQTENAGTLAHALRLRGDFAWAMAILPEPSIPTTQPATQPAQEVRSPESWLDEAAAAYQQVIEQHPDQSADVVASLFGLAAIAEQRGQFEEARGLYDQLLAREGVTEAVKAVATERRSLTQYLVSEVRLAAPAPVPTTGPATGSATRPVSPTTRATTQPAP